jgi:hypothetical protein
MKPQIRLFASCLTTTFSDVNANGVDPLFPGKLQKKKVRDHLSVYGSRVSNIPSKRRCLQAR